MKMTRLHSLSFIGATLGWLFLLTGFASPAAGETPWARDCAGVPQEITEGVIWTPKLCQEFNGSQQPPDTSAWSFDLGNDNGWGNHEVEIYCGPPSYPNDPKQCPSSFSAATANAFIDGNGHLVIQVTQSGGNWYSARLKTQGMQNFLYGRIEASIKLPNTANPGLWPAFWWLGANLPTVPWPNAGEADIMENWSPFVLNGPGPAGNRSTIHTAATGGPGIGGAYAFPSGQRADTGFYAYGVIWSANMLQFYVSPATGSKMAIHPFFIATASDLPSGDTWPFNASAFLLLNVAVGGTLGGSTSGTISPDVMTVDYVRQYAPSAAPAPRLGSPPPIVVTAGATTGNTSTFTPSLTSGTGYAYFSCSTNAPKASCSIKTNDPLNHFVVNSDASPLESVTVSLTTTSNALAVPQFLASGTWRRFPLALCIAAIIAALVLVRRQRIARRVTYAIVFSLIVVATAIAACGGGASGSPGTGGRGGGSGSIGTAPGPYAVTIYAFTEANASAGRNSNADAKVVIPVTVN